MIRPFLLLAAAASAAAAAAARSSEPAGEPFRATIPVADLDLATPAGRAAFAARVERLATLSCAPRPYPAVYEAKSLSRCRSDFRAAAEAAASRLAPKPRSAAAASAS